MAADKSLKERGIHAVRAVAQAFGVTDIFEKDIQILLQEIDLKQNAMITPKEALPDARLMTLQSSDLATPDAIVELLKDHIKIGLRVNLSPERWNMCYGIKTDEGTMRMPLITILRCANKLMS